MKKMIVISIILLLLSMQFAFAESCDEIISETGITEGQKFSKIVPYKNERFNIYVGDVEGHLILNDRIVQSIGCNHTTEPTFIVHIKDSDTIKEIKNAESPMDVFDDKLKTGDVTIEGVTVTKKIKGFFTKIGIKIGSWFS